MNVENEIQKMTEGLKKFDPAKPERIGNEVEGHFVRVRAATRGAIVKAHHELNPKGGWTEADDKMLDMVTIWLDNLKAR
jgi:hypothetical protein